MQKNKLYSISESSNGKWHIVTKEGKQWWYSCIRACGPAWVPIIKGAPTCENCLRFHK